MTAGVGFGKRSRLVADLAERICSGRLAYGERLPGENQLARRYRVSRGTVRGALSELQRRKLIATLRATGLHAARGEQWICVLPLRAAPARLLERRPGELFLHATRTTFTASGDLVEHEVSLLDPARFRFHLTFGGR